MTLLVISCTTIPVYQNAAL